MRPGVDYIGVGVGAIITNQNGLVFLARRGKKARNEVGCWEFPGGQVNFGETLADSLVREIREEFDIHIRLGPLMDVVDHILPEENQHWVSPTYICTLESGQPRILEPDKCSEINWFALDEIPDDLSKISKINLEHYRELIKA